MKRLCNEVFQLLSKPVISCRSLLSSWRKRFFGGYACLSRAQPWNKESQEKAKFATAASVRLNCSWKWQTNDRNICSWCCYKWAEYVAIKGNILLIHRLPVNIVLHRLKMSVQRPSQSPCCEKWWDREVSSILSGKTKIPKVQKDATLCKFENEHCCYQFSARRTQYFSRLLDTMPIMFSQYQKLVI